MAKSGRPARPRSGSRESCRKPQGQAALEAPPSDLARRRDSCVRHPFHHPLDFRAPHPNAPQILAFSGGTREYCTSEPMANPANLNLRLLSVEGCSHRPPATFLSLFQRKMPAFLQSPLENRIDTRAGCNYTYSLCLPGFSRLRPLQTIGGLSAAGGSIIAVARIRVRSRNRCLALQSLQEAAVSA